MIDLEELRKRFEGKMPGTLTTLEVLELIARLQVTEAEIKELEDLLREELDYRPDC